MPVLQWLPSPIKTRAHALHRDLVRTYGGLINDIEEKLKNGQHVDDCLAKTMVRTKREEKLDYLDMSILASAFMIGGVETVMSSLCFCLDHVLTSEPDSIHHAMVHRLDTSLPTCPKASPG